VASWEIEAWWGDWNSRITMDVMMPLQEAGSWQLLNTEKTRIDHLFGSGPGWEWRVIDPQVAEWLGTDDPLTRLRQFQGTEENKPPEGRPLLAGDAIMKQRLGQGQ
jgi:hypothetical protein